MHRVLKSMNEVQEKPMIYINKVQERGNKKALKHKGKSKSSDVNLLENSLRLK